MARGLLISLFLLAAALPAKAADSGELPPGEVLDVGTLNCPKGTFPALHWEPVLINGGLQFKMMVVCMNQRGDRI
ncbi:hypothetical protein K2X30_08435 [bacterium]|nr:hypothetical protein [bacterium]